MRMWLVAASVFWSCAAAVAGDDEPPPDQFYVGGYVSTGVGGRMDRWFALVNASSTRRWELGMFGAESEVTLGIPVGPDGVGFWGSAGATFNVFALRSNRVSPVFGLGPSVSFELLPEPAGGHIGFNVLFTAGMDLRRNGFATGLSLRTTTEIPVGDNIRRAPMITVGLGALIPDRTTVASRKALEAQREWERTHPPPPPRTGSSDLSEQNGGGGGDQTGGDGGPVAAPPGPTLATFDASADGEEACRIKVMAPILFEYSQAVPKDESLPTIYAIADVMLAHPEIKKLRLEGHTDSQGSASFNKVLSKARVDTVIRLLVASGVEADRLAGVGFGEAEPVVPDASTEEEFARNRRVIFRVVDGPNCVEAAK